jgi:thiosulfate/3-mercaptopyruvate sulfurtransferase
MNYARPELLAEPEWLALHLADPGVRLIDCGTGSAYHRAHIPGAVPLGVHPFIKEDDPEGSDHGVLVMGPKPFEDLMSRLGVGNDTTVAAYDDISSRDAARLWWALAYYGHRSAKVLNGGWRRWLSEGLPVTFEASVAEPRSFTAKVDGTVYATADLLKEQYRDPSTQVLDTRSDEEWRGTNDRGNRRAGRVPGARHLEWSRFVAADGDRRFLPADELQSLLDAAGLSRERATITYCQGGIRAAHAAFVLALMGHEDVRVYDGSMREWANRNDTPLTT